MSASLTINTEPKDITQVNTTTSVELHMSNLVFNSSIDINVLFKDSTGRVFKMELVRVQGDEYSQWGNDDNYLIDLVLSKVELSRNTTTTNTDTA